MISKAFYNAKEWCPAVIWGAIWLAVFPIRLLAYLILPPDAERGWHRLHNVYLFFCFIERD